MTTVFAMEKENIIILRVEGIICPGCAMDIENILLETDGILKVSVNYGQDTITVCYDCSEVDEKYIVDRVRSLGLQTTKT